MNGVRRKHEPIDKNEDRLGEIQIKQRFRRAENSKI